MKRSYIAGVAVLAVTVALAVLYPQLQASQASQSPTCTHNDCAWGPAQSAKVDQVILYKSGDIGYGLTYASGAVGQMDVVQDCGIHLGQTIIYQFTTQSDLSIGTQRSKILSPSGCITIPPSETDYYP